MSKKFKNLLLLIYLAAFTSLVIGASFAYFTALQVSKVSSKVNVTTAVTDSLLFDSGFPINIAPTIENFGEGMGNLSGETFASAYLQVDGDQEIAYKYNLYLELEKNTLTYSTVAKSPELLLTITDPDGNMVTNVENLEFTKSKDVEGFDITTKTGRYYIAKDYVIKSSTKAFQKWVAKVTYVNLDASQNGNFEKELKGYIRIEKAE